MAVAIIRSLTLAQVQAAIDAGSTSWNNNYVGTQIYVTDKFWTLQCYLNRECKPLSGVLKINNGDTLPAWLTPETLLIDTGVITTNIDGTEGNPGVTITVPTGYILEKCLLDAYSEDVVGAFSISLEADEVPIIENAPDFGTSKSYLFRLATNYTASYGNHLMKCSYVHQNSSHIQALIYFTKFSI